MYVKGEDVKQNIILAHMWFNIATSNGDEKAKEVREMVESYMTPEQITKVQKLARECIKKNYKDCG